MRKLIRNRKGQGLVEYALIIAGVALIAAVAISLFGHKVSDMIGAVATVLPGAHQGDNGPILSGHLIETTNADANGDPISLDVPGILAGNATGRLGNNVFNNNSNGFDGLIIESANNIP
jgi:pilus assembly protein Flp/PilA